LGENVRVSGTDSTNNNRLIGWTFLFLLLVAVSFFYGYLTRRSAVPSEEMQMREAQQRAHPHQNSN